jgi:glycosyltransferase involved in cell wall biosynthesis
MEPHHDHSGGSATSPETRLRSETVVFAVPDFEPAVGGTVRHAGLLARELRLRGSNVVVVTRRRSRADRGVEQIGGLRVIRLGPSGTGLLSELLALASLGWWLRRRRRRIAIVQTLMWPDASAAAALAGLLGRTVVMWAIRGEITGAVQERRSLARRLLVRARRRQLGRCVHVALTPTMHAEIVETGLPVESVVIPVPVDLSSFFPATPAERSSVRAGLEISPEAFVVLYVGHLERRKAVERLVEGFAQLVAEGSEACLLLVGGGRPNSENTEPAVRQLVHDRDLEEHVRFCGVQRDPRPYLHAADVFVLPSFREGMPNTLLEAMACGLPCIAPVSAGGDDVLNEHTGLVPRSNESAELFQAMAELYGDPDARARLGRAARERAKEFAVERVVDKLAALYSRLDARAR